MRNLDRRWGVFRVLAVAAAVTFAADVAAQEFHVSRFTIDGGGAVRSTAGGFELSGSIAQPDAGPVLMGHSFELTGGFWIEQVPADCDTDGGVGLFDFAAFEACVAGPGAGHPDPSCVCFDLDFDGDVDLRDWGLFQLSFRG